MKRKIIPLLLCLTLAFGLAACNPVGTEHDPCGDTECEICNPGGSSHVPCDDAGCEICNPGGGGNHNPDNNPNNNPNNNPDNNPGVEPISDQQKVTKMRKILQDTLSDVAKGPAVKAGENQSAAPTNTKISPTNTATASPAASSLGSIYEVWEDTWEISERDVEGVGLFFLFFVVYADLTLDQKGTDALAHSYLVPPESRKQLAETISKKPEVLEYARRVFPGDIRQMNDDGPFVFYQFYYTAQYTSEVEVSGLDGNTVYGRVKVETSNDGNFQEFYFKVWNNGNGNYGYSLYLKDHDSTGGRWSRLLAIEVGVQPFEYNFYVLFNPEQPTYANSAIYENGVVEEVAVTKKAEREGAPDDAKNAILFDAMVAEAFAMADNLTAVIKPLSEKLTPVVWSL